MSHSHDSIPPHADDVLPDLHSGEQRLLPLALGAIGVVFGDIGTSPLYAMKEVFVGHHPIAVDLTHIFGVISLIFWTMIIIVTLKYVFIVMRADNQGEGGSLALLALITRSSTGRRWTSGLVVLAVFATALFYGDSVITPAISVLSAVEGLSLVSPAFSAWVIPLAILILLGLFAIQSSGTAKVGLLFGPVMLIYFAVLAWLGLRQIPAHPEVLKALSPQWIPQFVMRDPRLAFLALGSVVLSITGAEALYADMGHFGRRPITLAWLALVFPCLIVNYLGQASLLIDHPQAAQNPFFLLAPDSARLPLVLLATLATVIASQAVISGAYSVTQQAVHLGLMPRVRIVHTSAQAIGQIYVPAVNWTLMVFVVLLVFSFRTSNNLAAAYGLAVTGTMFITAVMIVPLAKRVWGWSLAAALAMSVPFMLVDGLYFASNVTKIPDGGWFPLVVGLAIFTLLMTWSRGRKLLNTRLAEATLPVGVFIKSAGKSVHRIRGTSVFLTSTTEGVPSALLHNLKHNQVLHDRVILLTVHTANVPQVEDDSRTAISDLGNGFYRLVLRYGFMEEADVPVALKLALGDSFEPMRTSYFLSRQTLLPSGAVPGMALWREHIFALMMRNAQSAMDFFRLPTNRVVELGSQVEI